MAGNQPEGPIMDKLNAALMILRVGLGIVFLAHGIKHARGRAKTTAWFESLGYDKASFQWLASTATEIGTGALLVLGLLTGLAAAGVVGIMAVAFWTVHRKAGFFITAFMKPGVDVEGYEYVATLSLMALVVAIAGPGEWALDWSIEVGGVTLAEYLDGRIGILLVLGGIAVAAAQLRLFWRPTPRAGNSA
jgi:putative oxidoreductase